MRIWLGIFLCALAVWGIPRAAADDRIWSALVLATNETPPGETPKKLRELEPSLKRIFGYNTFYLLGEKRKALVAGAQEWLIPSRRIYVRLYCLERTKTAYRIRFELYDGKKLLVQSEVELARDQPLFIRGPEWGKGQLVLILDII